jgi:hypothetical protein
MSGEVEALAEALGDIRIAGARQEKWWTNDDDHVLLARVLRAECVPWAEGLLASDWLAARDARLIAEAERRGAERALREAAERMRSRAVVGNASHWRAHAWSNWLSERADQIRAEVTP